MLISTLLSAALCAGLAFACDDCYGPSSPEKHTRLVRRMQPGALSAVGLPSQPLEWGQLNGMTCAGDCYVEEVTEFGDSASHDGYTWLA